jgi:UDP-N-acetylmuramoylalanine--D-glutamate ligase
MAMSMAEAVRLASQAAKSGDSVLLSPGAASFDMFKDYKERGEAFKLEARRLAGQEGRGGQAGLGAGPEGKGGGKWPG